MEAFNKGNKGLSGMWANQDALETLKDHYKESDGTAKGFISKLFEDAEVLNGKKWEKLKPKSLENEPERIYKNYRKQRSR